MIIYLFQGKEKTFHRRLRRRDAKRRRLRRGTSAIFLAKDAKAAQRTQREEKKRVL